MNASRAHHDRAVAGWLVAARACWVLVTAASCAPATGDTSGDGAIADAGGPPLFQVERTVRVTLDGQPVAGAEVRQGGGASVWRTGDDGMVTVRIDPALSRERWLIASHPEARILGVEVRSAEGPLAIDLKRFDRSDNEAYRFQDPGSPTVNGSTAYCAHCHVTINADWYASPHRASASNPVLHDVYAGTASAIATAAACAAAGGAWLRGIGPGTGKAADRCYLGHGTLGDLNPGCGAAPPCDGVATTTGGCADCHAPGIDGHLGGRDLLSATGVPYDAGVHCDVCHKVESVDLAESPGVGGRLKILRPLEPSPSPALGQFLPLTFGPLPDVANPRMGSVYRELFHGATICAGCHQHEQPALVPGAALDRRRWPDGTIPVHTTYAEWLAGPFSPTTPCQSCHMPPDARVLNASDLQMFRVAEGLAGGWPRPPGTTRRHVFAGPRQPAFQMLRLAAALFVDKSVTGGLLTARVRVKNVGPGHALPTGEPMRSLVLRVEARCGGAPLDAVGGDAIPDFGGDYASKAAGEDWSRWPGARVGQVVRVVRRTGSFHDYQGFGPFGDGRFDAVAKGMPVEEVVGQAVIRSVNGDQVTFDRPLPAGDIAHLGDGDAGGALPRDGDPSPAVAGAPGFAFARVLVGLDGQRMVPHHRAVDVASDNRLLPGGSWTSEHRFAASCPDPEVHAVVVHRAFPHDLARERRWNLTESLMVEAWR